MEKLTVLAYAKLNLSLRVMGQRADGYHLLQSLMVAVDLADELHMERRPQGVELVASSALGPLEQNLVYKAAQLLHHRFGHGVRITLVKKIPVGAGLGGGSSDAAATLAGLNLLWDLKLAPEELRAMAAHLGADVPFFLGPSPAWVEGIGEQVQPVPMDLPPAFVIVVPPFGCPTPEVYRAYDRLGLGFARPSAPGDAWINDLWPAAVVVRPELVALRVQVEQVAGRKAHLSGSGSALFLPCTSMREGWDIRERLRERIRAQVFVAAPMATGYKVLA